MTLDPPANGGGQCGARKIRVLVVDDSALMRQVLSEILSRDAGLEVVGVAGEPYAAWDKIRALRPDVLTLDVEMPRMDGLTFLEKLMRLHPLPVVMVSSFTERGCATTLRALELGATDFVTKPKLCVQDGTLLLGDEILEKVRGAARARVARRTDPTVRPDHPRTVMKGPSPRAGSSGVVAIGASTGGPEALRQVLMELPDDAPGLVVVQHMPEHFTKSFAERLDSLCSVRVKEACDGDPIVPGHVLIAPGGFHMEVVGDASNPSVRVRSGEPVNRHKPSVDVLFHSCAERLGRHAVGVILTGMGADGAAGLLAMRDAGAATIAQDEATCVVFGMPREAIACGAVEEVAPLRRVTAMLLKHSCRLAPQRQRG